MYNSSEMCSMTDGDRLYGSPEASNRRVGFHYEHVDGQPQSEFLTIRRRAEPVPQNETSGRIIR
jgi:hypothetical protein